MERIQSPSSINLYKQCPRKYYYVYIKKLKTLPSIHTTRGVIAHKVLEDFFDINPATYSVENLQAQLTPKIQDMLLSTWSGAANELNQLDLTHDQKVFYFEETLMMLMNWLAAFVKDVEQTRLPFTEAFAKLTPIREKLYKSDMYKVKGFIDAIHKIDDEVAILDYKTSSRFEISEPYKLQLAIYALLYAEEHGVLPDKVGIFFLRDKKKFLRVDKLLVELAKQEISLIHKQTVSDDINHYPKNVTPLCKWSTGQCDFYDICFKQRSLNDF